MNASTYIGNSNWFSSVWTFHCKAKSHDGKAQNYKWHEYYSIARAFSSSHEYRLSVCVNVSVWVFKLELHSKPLGSWYTRIENAFAVYTLCALVCYVYWYPIQRTHAKAMWTCMRAYVCVCAVPLVSRSLSLKRGWITLHTLCCWSQSCRVSRTVRNEFFTTHRSICVPSLTISIRKRKRLQSKIWIIQFICCFFHSHHFAWYSAYVQNKKTVK